MGVIGAATGIAVAEGVTGGEMAEPAAPLGDISTLRLGDLPICDCGVCGSETVKGVVGEGGEVDSVLCSSGSLKGGILYAVFGRGGEKMGKR